MTAPVQTTPANPDDKNRPVRVFHTNKIGGSLVHGPIIDPETQKPAVDEEGKQVEFRLSPGESVVVPQFVADIWLTHTHYGSPVCALSEDAVSPKTDKLKEERDALAAENAEQAGALSDAAARIANLEKLLADLQKPASPAAAEGTSPSPEELASPAPAEAAPAKPKKPAKSGN